MNELFNIPESKSPKVKWMERHHLRVLFSAHESGKAVSDDEKYTAIHGMKAIAKGASHDDALVNAAKSLGIRLWNEENQ